MKTIRLHLFLFGLLVIWPVVAAEAADSDSSSSDNGSRPNVLLIMTDDQGWGDIGSHGNEHINTPVLDRLASEGARFERFFVSPVCAPTRASLLTGRYHLRCGVHGVTRGYETMRAGELTLAEALKPAGYATGCFGKWHNGAHYPHHPNGQGFDEFFGFCAGHWNSYFDTHLEHNGKTVQTEGYISDVLTDAALKFIEQHRRKPWLCYVPYNAPHSPWEVPDAYFEKYKSKEWDDKTACAYGMVENLDDNIGRLLKRLDELEMTDETIVIFLTDNGPNSRRYNGEMRGRKGSVHEGGVRVPLFVRWPGRIPEGKVIEPIAAHIDLLPTILDMCNVTKPRGPELDGRSLWPLLADEKTDWPDRKIYTDTLRSDTGTSFRGAVRTQRWRATFEQGNWSLYDMQADPRQKKNVADEYPDKMKRLSRSFDQWLNDVTQNGLDYIPIPVGHPRRPAVELPAHEAFLHPKRGEGIAYAGGRGYANCWVQDWTDQEAYPYWKLDVRQAGLYEVTLHYTCRKQDVGTRLRVSVEGDAVEGTIEQAHDPEPLPAFDRVPPRPHYAERIWAPLELGKLKLKKGSTRLRVQAIEKPGELVMDLKAVRLTPVSLDEKH